MNYWLFKSEPSEFSIDDLANKKGQREHWDGVRNYQARNFMRDKMRIGDLGFFYHSSCAQPAIVGIVRIVREAYPDHTAFDPTDKHFDEKSDPDAPRWFMVDVEFVEKLKQPITLQTLKACKNSAMSDFALTRRGNRLSIMPVTKQQWQFISGL